MTQVSSRRWSPPPLIRNPIQRWALILGSGIYLLLALSTLSIDGARIARGWERSSRVFAGFLQPDFASRWSDIQTGVLESLTMTVVATVIGVIISIPIGFGAAQGGFI
ncbi:MAG: hypothetical protein Fur0046_12310 [Cyanobacteria bacterium J069]|nr:MAG: hypothetical protein D6742_03240 [Cyanobacteria bacterium J069]